MLTVDKPLSQHLAEILDAVVAQLAAAQAAGQKLEDVRNINRGDRARVGDLRPPALWVMPGVDTIEESGGQATIHGIELMVIALVQGDDPDAAGMAAVDLASRAYEVLMVDKTWAATVHAVRPRQLDMTATRFVPRGGSQPLYAAAAVFLARVRRRE